MTDLPDVLAHLKPQVNVLDYPEAKPALLQLLAQYRQAFALPGEPLGVTTKVTHRIALQPGAKPSYVPSYRLPYNQRQVIQQKVDDYYYYYYYYYLLLLLLLLLLCNCEHGAATTLKRGYYSRIPISMDLTPLPCPEKRLFLPPCG